MICRNEFNLRSGFNLINNRNRRAESKPNQRKREPMPNLKPQNIRTGTKFLYPKNRNRTEPNRTVWQHNLKRHRVFEWSSGWIDSGHSQFVFGFDANDMSLASAIHHAILAPAKSDRIFLTIPVVPPDFRARGWTESRFSRHINPSLLSGLLLSSYILHISSYAC